MLESRERRTTIARTMPLPLHRSKEARFDLALLSCLIHISALMDPLVVWRVRFLRSVSEAMPGDGGGGGKERSRMNCPFKGVACSGTRFDIRR